MHLEIWQSREINATDSNGKRYKYTRFNQFFNENDYLENENIENNNNQNEIKKSNSNKTIVKQSKQNFTKEQLLRITKNLKEYEEMEKLKNDSKKYNK